MKPSEQRHKYKYRLVTETMLNQHLPANSSDAPSLYWLNRGIDMQPRAEKMFERQHNMQIEPVGFVTTDDGKLGCSPDGLIVGSDEREAVEIKAPAPWTQMEYLLAKADEDVWLRYRCQVQASFFARNIRPVY